MNAKLSWVDFKNFIDATSADVTFFETSTRYEVFGTDGELTFTCLIFKDGSTPQTQFEASYKNAANQRKGNPSYDFNDEGRILTQSRLVAGPENAKIGAIEDSLKVTTTPFDISQLATFKIESDVNLNSNVTYTTLLNVTGKGTLVSAVFVCDNDEVDCRITIDGNTFFEFNGEFLKEVVNDDAQFTAGIFSCSGDGKKIYFTPQNPVFYNTSLNFSARRSGRKIKFALFTYSVAP